MSTKRNSIPSLHFELDGAESSLQEMNLASVASDHQLAIGPIGIFVSADEERQGELIEYGVVKKLEFVGGK